jgi:hypothetical protein
VKGLIFPQIAKTFKHEGYLNFLIAVFLSKRIRLWNECEPFRIRGIPTRWRTHYSKTQWRQRYLNLNRLEWYVFEFLVNNIQVFDFLITKIPLSLPDYVVIRDEKTGEFVFADVDPNGELKITSFRVGKADPAKEGLTKGLRKKNRNKAKNGKDSEAGLITFPSSVGNVDPAKKEPKKGLRGETDLQKNKEKKRRNIFNNESRMLDDATGLSTIDHHHRRAIQTTGTVKNLVIPLKWNDHNSRPLPSRQDIDVLMNHVGAEERCPTGSVKDVFLENSYGKLELESTVVDWVLMPNTEAFYADSRSG